VTFLAPPSPDDPRPIFEQIMAEIRRAIARGTLGPDEPLPSTRQLAAELRVNPNTVQQAYRELERAGLIYVRRGLGSFVHADASRAGLRDAVLDEIARDALRAAEREGFDAEDLIRGIASLGSRADEEVRR
jgi:GntR family transcriptional regulator